MDLQLRDRVALVTGGASGIGRACAEALAAEGARVAVVDRDPAGAAFAEELGRHGAATAFVRADVTGEDEVAAAVADVRDRFGRLDAVLGCAGISGPVGAPAADVAVADWDRVMAVNVRGNFLVAKHALPALRESPVATIVLIASDAAFVAFAGMSAYNTSKGAVLMLTRSLAVDHPEIRANCLCPGVVDTPMSRADLGRPEGFAGTDLPVMQPEDLARHAVFLASPVSAPINGTSLVSDFGYLARPAVPPYEFATS